MNLRKDHYCCFFCPLLGGRKDDTPNSRVPPAAAAVLFLPLWVGWVVVCVENLCASGPSAGRATHTVRGQGSTVKVSPATGGLQRLEGGSALPCPFDLVLQVSCDWSLPPRVGNVKLLLFLSKFSASRNGEK